MPVASLFLAIDPGSHKWGLALVERSGRCVMREVTPAASAPERVLAVIMEHTVSVALLGDRTGAKAARERLESNAMEVPLLSVPEHGTTLEARNLYWRDHPPRGWRRLIPRGMLTPPEPLDAYAAEALALRYISGLEKED